MRPPQLLKIAAVAEKPQARVIFHFDGTIITVELSQSVECVCVCVCVCVFSSHSFWTSSSLNELLYVVLLIVGV